MHCNFLELDSSFIKNIVFTIVAILIACLGLFALASFTAQRRTREIGIRIFVLTNPVKALWHE